MKMNFNFIMKLGDQPPFRCDCDHRRGLWRFRQARADDSGGVACGILLLLVFVWK